MKKLLIIGIVFLIGIQVNAQEAVTPSGNITIDLSFDPAAIFDADAGSMFYMPYLKARYYIASDAAIRLGLQIQREGDTDYLDDEGDDYTKYRSTYFSLAPGFQKQFGSNRFYYYFGADLPFSYYTTREKSEINGIELETKNQDGGYFGLGLDLVIGVDFYIFPNFYIGAEFNPGFAYTKYFDETIDGDVTEKGGTSSDFRLSDGSGIRLGVRF